MTSTKWTDAAKAIGTDDEIVSLSSETLARLSDEAAAAGDADMVRLCASADAGSLGATRKVVRALASAEAQADS